MYVYSAGSTIAAYYVEVIILFVGAIHQNSQRKDDDTLKVMSIVAFGITSAFLAFYIFTFSSFYLAIFNIQFPQLGTINVWSNFSFLI